MITNKLVKQKIQIYIIAKYIIWIEIIASLAIFYYFKIYIIDKMYASNYIENTLDFPILMFVINLFIMGTFLYIINRQIISITNLILRGEHATAKIIKIEIRKNPQPNQNDQIVITYEYPTFKGLTTNTFTHYNQKKYRHLKKDDYINIIYSKSNVKKVILV